MNNQANMFYNFEQQNHYYTKVFHCQICRDKNHVALFCMKTSCVYSKSKEHVSYHCRTTEHVIKLICKLCNLQAESHSTDACKLGTMPNNNCQYCQNIGHEVTQCPTIAEQELCWKCKERGQDPFTCNKSPKITESCEGCGSTAHTAKNCPSALCRRCNNLGHLTKYCTINKTTVWCVICADEGHETADCENVKILIMQNRQQNSQNREIPLLVNNKEGRRTHQPDIKIRGRSPSRTVERYRTRKNDHVDRRPHQMTRN